MKNELLDFFKEKASGKGLIFNYLKGWYYGFLIATILLGIIGIALLCIFTNPLHQGITFITLFIIFAIIICIFNYRTKKFLKDTYSIVPQKFMWNGSEFQSLRRKTLYDYLRSKSLLSTEKVKILVQIYCRDADVVKVNIPVIPSILVILFVPLWSNLISWIYKQNDISTLNQALEIFGTIFLVILMITGLFMMVKGAIGSLIEDMINSEYRKMKNLCNMLEDIMFDLELGVEIKKNEDKVELDS